MRNAILIDHRREFFDVLEKAFQAIGAKIGWQLVLRYDGSPENFKIPNNTEIIFLHVQRWSEWFCTLSSSRQKFQKVFLMSNGNIDAVIKNEAIRKAIDELKCNTGAAVLPFKCDFSTAEGKAGLEKTLNAKAIP